MTVDQIIALLVALAATLGALATVLVATRKLLATSRSRRRRR